MVNLESPDLSRVFHALRDPVRRDFVERLRRGETAIAVLAAAHDISLPAVSRHVKILEQAGLVSRRRAGREFLLRLRPETLREAAAWINALTGRPAPPAFPNRHELPASLGNRFRVALSRRGLN